jgi:hypothetical protein
MDSFVAPLQGLFIHAIERPRAMPWAALLMPLRGGQTIPDYPRFTRECALSRGPTALEPVVLVSEGTVLKDRGWPRQENMQHAMSGRPNNHTMAGWVARPESSKGVGFSDDQCPRPSQSLRACHPPRR